MAPQATTNIRLAQQNTAGVYVLSQPGREQRVFTDRDLTLDQIAAAAGLVNGYWLRSTPLADATTWTWVQL